MKIKDNRLNNFSEIKGVGTISIYDVPSNPEDAFNHFQALAEQCMDMATSDRVHVVVCQCGPQPEGSAAIEAYSRAFALSAGSHLHRPSVVDALADMPQPVIVAIDGHAIGMELELALAGDIRVCSEASVFRMPQIGQGEIPCFGGTQRLARLVGRGRAMEMILSGDPVDANHALEIGLVNKVVAANDLVAEVQKMSTVMAAKGPIALQFTKEAVSAGLEMSLKKGLRLEADLYFLLHTTQDRTEGIRAFQEKRQGIFKGQ